LLALSLPQRAFDYCHGAAISFDRAASSGGLRELRLPPLSGALGAVIQGFRKRVAVGVPFDGATRWSNVRELQDKVRDAEDALERAKADAAREARVRAAKDAIENAQGPVAFPFERA